MKSVLVAMLGGCFLCLAPWFSPRPNFTAPRPVQEKTHASPRWAPSNVDAPIASLSQTPPCALEDVLAQAAVHAVELVTNLQNFTARERIRYEVLDDFNNPQESQTGVFDYLVFIKESRPGTLLVTETRNGKNAFDAYSGRISDSGLPAMALIFHPYYSGEYDMRCEGLGDWKGRTAWVVHFVQRRDRPSRIRAFQTSDADYPAKLKGRAWIAADSYQILHLETNLIEGVPRIHLRGEGVSIDYAPVQFKTRPVTLWLPESAEVYSDFGDLRYHVEHSFSNFLIFSVDVKENDEAPRKP
ncbi:MAG: hypothetical protein ACRD50_05675 [Candidatus Acidiferrales bacterium]